MVKQRVMYKHHCFRCKQTWESSKEKTKYCKFCRNPFPMNERFEHRCERCNYRWFSFLQKPKKCPRCQNPVKKKFFDFQQMMKVITCRADELNKFVSPLATSLSNENNLIVQRKKGYYIDLTQNTKK